MSGSSSSSKTVVHKFDKQFRAIQDTTAQILQQALGATLNQQQFQQALFGLLQPEFERLAAENQIADQLGSPEARANLLRESIDRNAQISAQAQQLGDQLTQSVQNFGQLTDTDRQLISNAIQGARQVGQSEIDKFVSSNFLAANEVAAARGLRPTDAPVGNIRGRVAEEATRQKGLLESQLGSQAAELALQLPQQRTALIGQLAGQQLGLAQAGEQFQASLAQNAAANRLNLAQTAGQLGLGLTGLAGTGPGVLGASRPAIGSTSSSASGGLLSTEQVKTNTHPVNRAEILRRMQTVPLQAWQYLWETGSEAFRIGPYAEDFQEAFGGESYQIDPLHALGVAMAALQELTERVERIEQVIEFLATEKPVAEAN